jgi:hypothetical protein
MRSDSGLNRIKVILLFEFLVHDCVLRTCTSCTSFCSFMIKVVKVIVIISFMGLEQRSGRFVKTKIEKRKNDEQKKNLENKSCIKFMINRGRKNQQPKTPVN